MRLNHMMVTVPLLSGTIAVMAAMGPPAPLLGRAVGGAVTGGLVATGWEYTVNSADSNATKRTTIMGAAELGAISGVVGPPLMAMLS